MTDQVQARELAAMEQRALAAEARVAETETALQQIREASCGFDISVGHRPEHAVDAVKSLAHLVQHEIGKRAAAEAEAKRLRRLSELQDKLLAAYRMGRSPAGKVLDEMAKIRAALASRPEPERPNPTHRCKVCGALWRLNEWPCDWTLYSAKAGACCDNQPMGEQIEPITEFHRLCDPGPMGEPAPESEAVCELCGHHEIHHNSPIANGRCEGEWDRCGCNEWRPAPRSKEDR